MLFENSSERRAVINDDADLDHPRFRPGGEGDEGDENFVASRDFEPLLSQRSPSTQLHLGHQRSALLNASRVLERHAARVIGVVPETISRVPAAAAIPTRLIVVVCLMALPPM